MKFEQRYIAKLERDLFSDSVGPVAFSRTFSMNCAPRYTITKQQVSEILELLALVEKHKRSPLEFSRKDKIVIMSENLKTTIVDIEKIKQYLILSKEILKKANSGMTH